MRTGWVTGAVWLGVALALPAWAQAPVRVVLCPRLTTAATQPSIAELRLALTAEPPQTGFSPLSDVRRAAARATEFRLAWDDANLYLLTVCPVAGGPPFRAGTHDHDGELWRDDAVEVFLQPPGSAVYYHFGWNAAGTQAEERVQDRSWNPAWRLRVELTDRDWTSLAVLPFAALETPPSPDAAWRLNVCRSDAANAESSSWSFSGGGFHRPERFGWLLFTRSAAGETPVLSEPMVAHIGGLFFDPDAVRLRQAEIAELLRQETPPGAAVPPRLAALRTQLGDQDLALRQVLESCASLDATRIAVFIAQASQVPELSARAAETLVRWRIERLLGSHEAGGQAGR